MNKQESEFFRKLAFGFVRGIIYYSLTLIAWVDLLWMASLVYVSFQWISLSGELISYVSLVLSLGWYNLYPLVYYLGGELSIILYLYLSVFIYHLYYQSFLIISGSVWDFPY